MAEKPESNHQVEQIFSTRIIEIYISCIKENRIELHSDKIAMESTLSTTGDMLAAIYNSRKAQKQRSFPVSAPAASSTSQSSTRSGIPHFYAMLCLSCASFNRRAFLFSRDCGCECRYLRDYDSVWSCRG